jgi:predicted ATP-grasp superfamily ATP-dependent carboligase
MPRGIIFSTLISKVNNIFIDLHFGYFSTFCRNYHPFYNLLISSLMSLFDSLVRELSVKGLSSEHLHIGKMIRFFS